MIKFVLVETKFYHTMKLYFCILLLLLLNGQKVFFYQELKKYHNLMGCLSHVYHEISRRMFFFLKQPEPIIQQEYATFFKLEFCLANCQIIYCLKGAVSARSRTPCKSTRSVVIYANSLRRHGFPNSYYTKTCRLFQCLNLAKELQERSQIFNYQVTKQFCTEYSGLDWKQGWR